MVNLEEDQSAAINEESEEIDYKSTSDIFTRLMKKKTFTLTGGDEYDVNNKMISKMIRKMDNDISDCWHNLIKLNRDTYLWKDIKEIADKSINGTSLLSRTYERLKSMALAYATIGSRYYRNAKLKDDIVYSIRWLHQHYYDATLYPEFVEFGEKYSGPYGNWFHWQIRIPMALNDILCLLYNDISKEELRKYEKQILRYSALPDKMTAANTLLMSKVYMDCGILLKDSALIEIAMSSCKKELKYVDTWDGFYKDGSFVQHGIHPYTGGYGASFLRNISNILYIVNGTPYDLTEDYKSLISDLIFNTYQPFIYKGLIMDMVRGRDISVASTQGCGKGLICDILKISDLVNPTFSEKIKRRVKYWLQQSSSMDFPDAYNIAEFTIMNNLLNDQSIQPAEELILHKHAQHMDRVVHLRPGFGFGLSMSSERTANYECMNEANLQGWYIGDGMTYLYDNDLFQYSNDFWATINRYRLPGTTVDTIKRENASGQSTVNPSEWVGGCTIEDQFGINGMQLNAFDADNNGKTLTAKKSWFMFDDEIVCLGSDINNDENRTIETIIENRKIDGDNSLIVNGSVQLSEYGKKTTFYNTRWVHLSGHAEGAGIGYFFPKSAAVKGLREKRTDSWHSINQYAAQTVPADKTSTRNYMTLWFDHGKNPQGAQYEYVLLPNKTLNETKNYVQQPGVTVLENSTEAHAVKDESTNIIGINFWSHKSKRVDIVTCDSEASVMIKENIGKDLSLGVADPTWHNTGSIKIEINKKAAGVIQCDPEVQVVQLEPTIKICTNVQDSKGKTFNVKLKLYEKCG